MISRVKYRPNKIAKGFTKHYERRNKKINIKKERLLLSLILYGTCDELANRAGGVLHISKRIKKEHPIDKGYFRDVIVLSDYGKKLLKKIKQIRLIKL